MQEKKILIQMRDLRVGSGIASCIMKYYEYTVEQGYTIDFLLNRNIDSPFVDKVIFLGTLDSITQRKKFEEYIEKQLSNR